MQSFEWAQETIREENLKVNGMSLFKEVCYKRKQKNRLLSVSRYTVKRKGGYFLRKCLPLCLCNNGNNYRKEKNGGV